MYRGKLSDFLWDTRQQLYCIHAMGHNFGLLGGRVGWLPELPMQPGHSHTAQVCNKVGQMPLLPWLRNLYPF